MGRKTVSFGAKGRPVAKNEKLSVFDRITTAMKEAAVNVNPLSDEEDSIFGMVSKPVRFGPLSPISQSPMGRPFGTFPVKLSDADAVAAENAKGAFESQVEANRKSFYKVQAEASQETLPDGRLERLAACCPDPECQACAKKRESRCASGLAEAAPIVHRG